MSDVLLINTPALAIQGAIDSCPGLRRVGADVHVTDVLGSALVAGSLTNADPTRAHL